MIRGLTLAAIALAPIALAPLAANAADLDGVSMPETRVVDGVNLRLNGIGLRTYSVVGIHIYVAGLYLERQSDNPDSILHSPERKLLDLHFVHDVGAKDAREAWQDGFASNCKPPACYLDPGDVQRFLAAVPAVRRGDQSSLWFTPKGVNVTLNGRPMGQVNDPHFATAMLATFIGPVPPSEKLKRELLGSGN
ncbi:chalcone isomerase family protein [Rhodopila sp.]|uniref:chalcone isomerase family protein n=1 Tax=Rhodopila sp. TaxID=2480087 RepID=UPI003D0C0D89